MDTPSDADQEILDMFGRKKNDAEEAKNAAGGEAGEARQPEGSDADMPLDVPSREPPPAAPSKPAPAARTRPSRRVAAPQTEPIRRIAPGADSEGKCLVVGRSIALSGRIDSCEMLVVEGSVETEMKGCRELEIARTGTFKGNAEVESADISGTVEGTLIVHSILTVRASGRVLGNISYGQLEIERGGTLVGDVQPLTDDDSRETASQLAAESPAG